MNAEERVLAAISLAQPNRVPLDFSANAVTLARLQRGLGTTTHRELLDRLHVDIVDLRGVVDPIYRGPIPQERWRHDAVKENFWGWRTKVMATALGPEECYVDFVLARAISVEQLAAHPFADWSGFTLTTLTLPQPRFVPPLDPDFRPASLAVRAFDAEVAAAGGVPLVLGLERADGELSRFETRVLPEGHPDCAANFYHVERLVKFLLWARGGWRLFVGGPRAIGEYLAAVYAPDGARAFDYHFLGEQVYQRPFTVVPCAIEEVPPAREAGQALGRHLDGCRIGFDLGASDLKVSAVMDGEPVFSEEIVWEPVEQADPDYHYSRIRAALKLAQSKLPRLDAIGGSAAGIYIANRPMVASLFRGVPAGRYAEIRTMFLRLRAEFGVPLEVINDGDVTALAGAMSLEDDGVLGIALGSSEAAGYVDRRGAITGWLNELAFAPVDYNPAAPADEWSGDIGVGSQYFSQQCVFRLAPAVGIALPADATKAEKLKYVQGFLEAGHSGARQIWESIGIYLGYGLAHYASFYDLKHVLILGRVTSGSGGPIILERAQAVLAAEFPALAERVNIQLPDEKSRRVGQSIAAASLPGVK